jgi:hypothetical protein
MLTTMTEQDWKIALQVFQASRSRRGDKGQDDRRFLEALHYFVVTCVRFRPNLGIGTVCGNGSGD